MRANAIALLLLVVPSASHAAECAEAVAAAAAAQLASCAALVGFTIEAPLTAAQTTRICATCTSLADATKRKVFGYCTVTDATTSTTVVLQTRFDALFVCSLSSSSSSGSGSAEIETPAPATKTPTPTPVVSSSSGSGSAVAPVPTIIGTPSPGSDEGSQSSSGSISPNSSSSSSSRGNEGASIGSGSKNGTTPISSSVTDARLRTHATIGSTISIGMVIGIAGGVVVLVISIATFIVCRQRRNHKRSRTTMSGDLLLLSSPSEEDESHSGLSKPPFTLARRSGALNETFLAPPSHGGLWDDEAIIAVRIPREKVLLHALVSRGGYGEVYRGVYNGQSMAIKTLLPETRKNMKQISAFLAETKLVASLEHERIVRFIGVAWDSLTDLCVISEFMEGGDLRALLVKFEDVEYRPHGFDDDKIRIALHIAHALTYLHSLQPIVLHRDLKSKNILLDARLNAKLTDFGVSRKRSDRTMTAGVGSSLWMAPEVMLGERYDDKADVFSFGIVLSELDSHQLPYENVKESGSVHRRIPDTTVLQMVALGRLRVQFSEHALPELVQLAHACVALDPASRPTAADVLCKLHNILKASQGRHIAQTHLEEPPAESGNA